jgi:(R,R)-butanediol dehydrogenase / meso-butanediol dehydrogenase / diacetyl reductase
MRAAVYHGRGDVRVEERPAPLPARDELLLEVLAVGICGTDAGQFAHGPNIYPVQQRHAFSGHLGPLVPGHEVAGRVVAMGDDVEGFTVGEVVACGGTVWCGTCRPCRGGSTNLCEQAWSVGLHRNGGLAELCAVPARSCAAVAPYGLTADTAALAQPMAIAVHATGRGEPVAGEHALVLGVGGVGTFITWALAQAGVTTTVCDLDPARLAIAKALGATTVLQAARGALATTLGELPAPPDLIYEVTGSAEGLRVALAVVGAGGRVVVVGHQHGSDPPVNWFRFALLEHKVIGTQALVGRTDLPEALRLLAARPESWADLAPTALPLDRLVDDGLVPLAEGRATQIKTLVDPLAPISRATHMTPPVGAHRRTP